jgi:hypothetical protein
VVFVGPEYLKKISEIIPFKNFIVIPEKSCWIEKDRIIKDIRDYGKKAVYCFSASMPAEVIMADVWKDLPDSILIDFGSLWDVFVDHNTRWYHGVMEQNIKNKNLGL